jgi:hypothetical protein
MVENPSTPDDAPETSVREARQETWAKPVTKLKVSDVPSGAIAFNLDGRQLVGPLQGFGPMWKRTYRVRLSGVSVTPAEVIADWKENFANFQPSNNHFYPSLTGVKPGEVVFINTNLPIAPGAPGIIPMKSGVMVLYSDDELFTVMTPEGFPISGWNTFSAYEEEGGTVAQVQALIRTSDPIYEFGFRFMGGEKEEDKVWFHVLETLSARWGIKGQVQFHKEQIDSRIQWKSAKNVYKNAAIRTFLYVLATPIRWLANLGRKQP